MIAAQYITLSELQRRVRQVLEERFALPLWVSAEIAEVKVNYSGHCYLELVEKGEGDGVPKAQARAVIWRSQYARIAAYFEAETGQRLAAGMRILAKATVNYHELYGFSLQLLDVDPAYTLGDMERQRQQTIARLQAEGVWEMNRQQAMPAVVQRIAVVSSSRAAGYQDFCNELAKSPYRFCLTLFDAVVQGAAAEDSIVDALSRIAAAGEAFDAVVMIRGGGSSSDLNCFNAYRLCNHGYYCDLPYVRELQKYPWCKINPATAKKYGIADGDWMKIESPHGWIRLTAEYFEGIAPDVLMAKRGWWQSCEELGLEGYGFLDGGCEANALYDATPENFDPFTSSMGKQTLVKISKYEGGNE